MRSFDWRAMWLPSWSPLEVALRAALVYLFLFGLMRVVGRKELGRYANFDVAMLTIITIAARQSIVGTDTSVTSAFVGLATIFMLDWLFSKAVFHSGRAALAIEGEVLTLVKDGQLQERELARARLSSQELLSRLREQHTESLNEVERAYFERSGRVTFVFRRAPP